MVRDYINISWYMDKSVFLQVEINKKMLLKGTLLGLVPGTVQAISNQLTMSFNKLPRKSYALAYF